MTHNPILVTDDDGSPVGFVQLDEVLDAGTNLAFRLAATGDDEEAYERICQEALELHGSEGFGYVAASALRVLAKHAIAPMATLIAAMGGPDVLGAFKAISEHREPPPWKAPRALRVDDDDPSILGLLALLLDSKRWPDIAEQHSGDAWGSPGAMSHAEKLAAALKVPASEVLDMSYLDTLREAANMWVRARIATLHVWALENGRRDIVTRGGSDE